VAKRPQVDVLAWAAGVIEGSGRIVFRTKDGDVIAVIVYACVDEPVAIALTKLLDTGTWSERQHRWTLPAADQQRVLSALNNYWQTKTMRREAWRVIQYRIVQTKRVTSDVMRALRGQIFSSA